MSLLNFAYANIAVVIIAIRDANKNELVTGFQQQQKNEKKKKPGGKKTVIHCVFARARARVILEP